MQKKVFNLTGIFIMPVMLFIVFTAVAGGFGLHSLPIVVSQSIIPTVMGFGVAVLMGVGLLDLSAGVLTILAAVTGGFLAQYLGTPGLIIGCIGGGLAGGMATGFLYRLLKIPSLVISLGIMLIFEVLSAKIAGMSGFLKITDEMAALGSFPFNLLIALIAGIVFYIVYYRARIGCLIQAVGNDEKMAKNMGIHTDSVKFQSYILGGLFFGIAGLLQICYSASITANIGMSSMALVFKPLIGVIIGTQLLRFVNNLALLIFIGEISLLIIFNGFIALGFSSTVQNIILGLFLILVMVISLNSSSLAKIQFRKKLSAN